MATHASAHDRGHRDVPGVRSAAFSLDLSPRTVLRRLLVAVAVLAVASVAGQVLLREVPALPLGGGIAHSLYVDSEQSLPTIFTVLLVAAAAALLAVIAALNRRARSRDSWYWAAASALALLLALDEYLSLHEQLIEPLRGLLGTQARGPLYYAWVVPGLLAVVVVTAAFFPFLRRLPAELRTRALLSAALYLAGALGMEMVGGAIESATGNRESYAYLAATTVEETLEMVAVALLLYALLDHLSETFDVLDIRARLRGETGA